MLFTICNLLLFTRESMVVVSDFRFVLKVGHAVLIRSVLHMYREPCYYAGHYYSYVRPEIRTNHWYRFDDEIVTRVDWADVVADAYGGNGSLQQKKSRNANLGPTQAPNSRQRFFFWPILALIRLFRRATLIGSNTTADFEHQFGYGGENSNAYMLQYVRQVDIPILYLEESDK